MLTCCQPCCPRARWYRAVKSCAVIKRNSATPLAAEAGGAVLSVLLGPFSEPSGRWFDEQVIPTCDSRTCRAGQSVVLAPTDLCRWASTDLCERERLAVEVFREMQQTGVLVKDYTIGFTQTTRTGVSLQLFAGYRGSRCLNRCETGFVSFDSTCHSSSTSFPGLPMTKSKPRGRASMTQVG